MAHPPFRPAALASAARSATEAAPARSAHDQDRRAHAHVGAAGPEAGPRLRLGEMDAHWHCSVIGTCLPTGELRKLMGPFIDVADASDLEVHHEAVRLAGQDAGVARALHKALDRRHEGSVQRYARAKEAAGLVDLWQQALDSGEVPGAYWAVLTHRRATPELRQRVFGDVHMLSHQVGASNRADLRRLAALERENAELRERAERQQQRIAEIVAARDQSESASEGLRLRVAELERAVRVFAEGARAAPAATVPTTASCADAVATQTRRREAAEGHAQSLLAESLRMQLEFERLHAHATELGRELAAAEAELRARAQGADEDALPALRAALAGRRLLYVGGRPSSNPAIRDLVRRHGGDYQRHDGGIEDRKGLLAAALAWADLVVFPVDCIDHESALALKRACGRQGKPFVPLRSASVASFAAAVAAAAPPACGDGPPQGGPCLKHG